jgi:hypothetical protein
MNFYEFLFISSLKGLLPFEEKIVILFLIRLQQVSFIIHIGKIINHYSIGGEIKCKTFLIEKESR